MLYLSIDFMLNKDQRYEDLINEYEEIDSYLLHNLFIGNFFPIIALIVVFSLEFISYNTKKFCSDCVHNEFKH